jgi:hypothetical protein
MQTPFPTTSGGGKEGVGEQKGKLGEEMFLALMVGAGMGEATRVF